MKNIALIKMILLIVLLNIQFVSSQITINSLQELKSYSIQDNVVAVMTPGTYVINSTITGAGKLLPDPIMFEFSGSNSTYDFTGVTFEFNTEILNDYGNIEVVEIRVYGDNNVLKNLTMKDIGTDAPRKRARAIHLDGLNNRIEGFHITVQGSYPYGYGDLFGKGSGSVIGHRKHSGILVRGDGNHIKDCTVIHRSYGHGIFIQGGKNVLIEGVYMEGDALRTTDDVLLEQGTGSAADNVDFLTVWGYTVPAGYMFSKHEDGIRTYASAGLYSNDKTGADVTSYTGDVTVKNCTIKRMRSGYSFAFGSGKIVVEDSQSLECESGFSIKSNGVIKNCSGDAKYGAVYGNAYNSDDHITADITILNSDNGYGPHDLAYVGGSDHNITFKTEAPIVAGRGIQLAGEKKSMRMLNGTNASQTRHNSESNKIVNHTGYPLLLDAGSASYNGENYSWVATNNIIETCGDSEITDKGSNNSVVVVNCNDTNVALEGTASQSSTDYGGLAEYAIDGNIDGDFKNGSVTHTSNDEIEKWWQVDLGKDHQISTINIYNRTKSNYGERLNNFTVEVLDCNGNVSYTNTYVDHPNPLLSISTDGVVGCVVKISKTSDKGITLAEVEVMGSAVDQLEVVELSDNQVQIFPNPVKDSFTISDCINAEVKMYSVSGECIINKSILSNRESIDISSFKSGLYFVQIIKNESKIIKKLIKI